MPMKTRRDRRKIGRIVRRLRRLARSFSYSAPTARERVTVTKDGVLLDLSMGPLRRAAFGVPFPVEGKELPKLVIGAL